MRMKIALIGAALVLVSVILVACNSQGNVTATPAGAAAAITTSTACTPTPAVPAPTYTIGPNERSTPAIVSTKIAQYHAAYPGDLIVPAHTMDLYPQTPADKKEKVVVRHQNCTYDAYLLPATEFAGFETRLPSGDVIVGDIGPPSQQGAHVPVPTRNPSQIPGAGSKGPGVVGSPPIPVPSPPSVAFQTEIARSAQRIATDAASATAATRKP